MNFEFAPLCARTHTIVHAFKALTLVDSALRESADGMRACLRLAVATPVYLHIATQNTAHLAKLVTPSRSIPTESSQLYFLPIKPMSFDVMVEAGS